MICEVGKEQYPLPRDFFLLVDTPLLNTGPPEEFGHSIHLMRLSPVEMGKKVQDADEALAMPRYFAIVTNNEFWLHPTPDKPYAIHLLYHTRPKVW
jgi:hypothetical protein